MNTWRRSLVFRVSFLICVASGFVVFMYVHHDRYWTPNRFGGLWVALACVPICLVSHSTAIAVRVVLPILEKNKKPH
jgi:hypothetical protein